MGQAKRRRELTATYAPGRCNGCNLCCVLFDIPELSKPQFVPCANICEAGCSIHGAGQPQACVRFECDYILAHKLDLGHKAAIPHPKDAGAYVGHLTEQGIATLYVDPKHPRKWQSTTLPTYLKALIGMGLKIGIYDRGYRVVTETAVGIDELASIDIAEFAAANGAVKAVEYPPAKA